MDKPKTYTRLDELRIDPTQMETFREYAYYLDGKRDIMRKVLAQLDIVSQAWFASSNDDGRVYCLNEEKRKQPRPGGLISNKNWNAPCKRRRIMPPFDPKKRSDMELILYLSSR